MLSSDQGGDGCWREGQRKLELLYFLGGLRELGLYQSISGQRDLTFNSSTDLIFSDNPFLPLLSLSSRDVPLSTGRPYNGRSISTDPDVQSNRPRVYILYHRSVYQVSRPSESSAERSSADPVVLPFSLPSVSFSSSSRIHPTSPASSSSYVSAS